MYSEVKYSKNIARPLYYNDEKLRNGKAECLLAENFLKDPDRLSHKDKLCFFKSFMSLNGRTAINAVHIDINFHPHHKPSRELMKSIAIEYMDKIGLGAQPYLVYRHFDAAHDHLHIVSTNINAKGKRIDLLDIILHKNRKTALEIAEKYSLASGRREEGYDLTNPEKFYAKKIAFGESRILSGIWAILDKVIKEYAFASLAEFNAVLRPYNVFASRGEEGSKMYNNGGLFYCVLDEEGKMLGKGIKASKFKFKPILRNLQVKFAENAPVKERYTQRVKTAVDWAFTNKPYDLPVLQKELEKDGIQLVPEKDKKGAILNVFYIDHQNRVVFDGNLLGERYSAEGIRARWLENKAPEQDQNLDLAQNLRLGLL